MKFKQLKNKKMNTVNLKIGDAVLFNNCFCCATILEINGKTAKLSYLNEVITKRLSSLSLPKEFKVYEDEQEIAHKTAVYKDGEIAFSEINSNGDGGVYVWQNNNIVKR
jgi:hypothetical protein